MNSEKHFTNFFNKYSPLGVMKAVFLTAFLTMGPEILLTIPRMSFSESEEKEISLKSMPMAGNRGDFISVHLGNYQIASLLLTAPSPEEVLDPRDIFVSIGFLLTRDENAVPYRSILEQLVAQLELHHLITINSLKKILPQLHRIFEQSTINIDLSEDVSFELSIGNQKEEKTGLDLLDDALW